MKKVLFALSILFLGCNTTPSESTVSTTDSTSVDTPVVKTTIDTTSMDTIKIVD